MLSFPHIFMNSKFTFCIPNLNKIKYLPTCIESMQAQTEQNWSCIFVDGYSTDGSWEYMQQYAADPRFKLFRGIQQGMYPDWNECLKHVNTEYFYFLTSDDTCYPDLVATTIHALDQLPAVHACHFRFDWIDEFGVILELPESLKDTSTIYDTCNQFTHLRNGLTEFLMHFAYRTIYTTITSLVFRYPLIKKLQGFSNNYSSAGDYDWTMRMVLYTDVLYLPQTLATWRIYGEQATQATSSLQRSERLLAIAQTNLKTLLQSSEHRLLQQASYGNLLNDFFDEHAAALLASAVHAKTPTQKLAYLYKLLGSYPFYIGKKLINRASFDRLFSYPERNLLAHRLIRDHKLSWPPKPIVFPS